MAKKEEKVLYLTFDDGPDTVYTNKLLDLLEQEQVPATFFMVAEAAQGHPDIVKQMKEIIRTQHTPNPHFSVTLPSFE